MALAMRTALAAEARGEVPVGAVVVRDGQVIGTGGNAVIGSADPTAHAEIVALRDAAARLGNYRLSGATLYCTIEPCAMCAGALIHARIARLVYGAAEPRAGAVHSHLGVLDHPGANHRVEVLRGVLGNSCARMMRDFFRARRADARGVTKAPPPDDDRFEGGSDA